MIQSLFSPTCEIKLSDLKFLQVFFDALPLGILVANKEGRIIYCNEAQTKIDDMSIDEITGKLEVELYDPYAGPGIVMACQLTGSPLLGYVCSYRTVKGKVVNGAYWVYPLYDEKGEVGGSLCLTQLAPTKAPLFPVAQTLTPEEAVIMASARTGDDGQQQDGGEGKSLTIVGKNLRFRRMLNLAETTASSPSPVLIAGETGTGKEMLVKMIVNASDRREKPYLAINCSAIPTTLLEVILFGATKGSFTGAIDRAGLLEQANGGTVYLDEIDSMPLELQPKILRVLQNMKVSRLGSSHEINLDIKVISSIGQAPEEAITSGRLRADLFYRLAVITLMIPPLRERKDDIDELMNHFVQKYNKILNKEVHSISPQVSNLLHAYEWPGNVRELEHFIAGAINVTAWETVLQPHHIPEFYKPFILPRENDSYHFEAQKNIMDKVAHNNHNLTTNSLQQAEIDTIIAALEKSAGHVTNAAKILNISRQLLNYKLKKHNIDRKAFSPMRS